MEAIWRRISIVTPWSQRYAQMLVPKDPLVVAHICQELSGPLLGYAHGQRHVTLTRENYAEVVAAEVQNSMPLPLPEMQLACLMLYVAIHPTSPVIEEGIQLWIMQNEATPRHWQVWTGHKYCYGNLAHDRFTDFREKLYANSGKRVGPSVLRVK